MDVSKHKKVPERTVISSVPNVSTSKIEKFTDDYANRVPDPQNNQTQDKMREHITYFVLFLLLLIVVYGLIMQNWWLIGTICFPVIAYGVYKIFDRYL